MKVLLFLLISFGFAANLHAQQTVQMKDGKQVLLYDNGTWKYLAQNNLNSDQDKNIQRAGYVKGNSQNTNTENNKPVIILDNSGKQVELKTDGTWQFYKKDDGTPR